MSSIGPRIIPHGEERPGPTVESFACRPRCWRANTGHATSRRWSGRRTSSRRWSTPSRRSACTTPGCSPAPAASARPRSRASSPSRSIAPGPTAGATSPPSPAASARPAARSMPGASSTTSSSMRPRTAASTRSRQLLDQAVYKPVIGRFKVYMIDEVHMLTATAFNAMLKTLEEPPEYLKFVLATTDPQKVPATVLSRCLQFNLRPMAPQTIVEHLGAVLGQEGLAADASALRLIARAARGSMRDALSITDQAIAYGSGAVEEEPVRRMLGAVDRGHAVAAGRGARGPRRQGADSRHRRPARARPLGRRHARGAGRSAAGDGGAAGGAGRRRKRRSGRRGRRPPVGAAARRRDPAALQHRPAWPGRAGARARRIQRPGDDPAAHAGVRAGRAGARVGRGRGRRGPRRRFGPRPRRRRRRPRPSARAMSPRRLPRGRPPRPCRRPPPAAMRRPRRHRMQAALPAAKPRRAIPARPSAGSSWCVAWSRPAASRRWCASWRCRPRAWRWSRGRARR